MSAYAWSARRPSVADVGRAGRDVAIGAIASAFVGLLVGIDPFYAVLPAAALVGVWLTVRPRAAAICLGASIPAIETVASGHLGLHIGAPDLLLLLLLLAAVGAAVLERDGTTFTCLRPVGPPVLQYCVYVVVLLFAHPGFQPVIQTFQRYELIAFPLIVGAFLTLRNVHIGLLKAYLVAATLLALVYPFDSLGLQKNPAGQFVCNAILLLIAAPSLSRYRMLLPLLVYGMFATESRGALAACVVGVAIILIFRWMHSPGQALAIGFAVVAIGGLSFMLMPPSAQSFITTYNSQGKSHGAYNIRFRQQYQRDALKIIRQHPWLGVGVGSYGAVIAKEHLVSTDDPHDVVLLQAAEGGWLFAASFVVLIGGAVLALVRLRRIELAPAAIAILVATMTHGLVDEYWVRGIPVLGWLLTGTVCARVWQQRQETVRT